MKLSNTSVLHAAVLGSVLVGLLVSMVEASTELPVVTLQEASGTGSQKSVIGRPVKKVRGVSFVATNNAKRLYKSISEKTIVMRTPKKKTDNEVVISLTEKSKSSSHLLTSSKESLPVTTDPNPPTLLTKPKPRRQTSKISLVDEPIELEAAEVVQGEPAYKAKLLLKSTSEKTIGLRKPKKKTATETATSLKQKSRSSSHLLASSKEGLPVTTDSNPPTHLSRHKAGRRADMRNLQAIGKPTDPSAVPPQQAQPEDEVSSELRRNEALLNAARGGSPSSVSRRRSFNFDVEGHLPTDRRYVRNSILLGDNPYVRRNNHSNVLGKDGKLEAGRKPERHLVLLEATGPLITAKKLEIDLDLTLQPLILTHEGLEADLPPSVERLPPREFGVRAKGVILPSGAITRSTDLVHSGLQMITALHTVGLGEDYGIENTIRVYDIMTGNTLFTQKHTSNSRLNLYASSNTLVVIEYNAERNPSYTALATFYDYSDETAIVKSTLTIPCSVSHVRFSEDSSRIAMCGYSKTLVLVKDVGYYILDTKDVELGDRWLLYQATLDQQDVPGAILLLDTLTGVCKLAYNELNDRIQVNLSKDTLLWTRQSQTAHVVAMLDLTRKESVPIQLVSLPASEFTGALRPCLFGDFYKTDTILLMGQNGSLSLLNVAKRQVVIVYPDEYEDFTTSMAYSNSPLVLRDHSSRTFIVLHLQSHMDIDNYPAYRAKVPEVNGDDILRQDVRKPIANFASEPAPTTRFIPMLVEDGYVYAFDGDLNTRYVVSSDLMVTSEPIVETAQAAPYTKDLSSIGVEGTPQAFQTNSDGTVFFLAAQKGKDRYIYIIDYLKHTIADYQVLNLHGADIVRMDAYSKGTILVVTTDDQSKFILSCRDYDKLSWVNKLSAEHRIVFANDSTAVIESRSESPDAFQGNTAAKPAILFLDLLIPNSEPFLFPNPDASFLMFNEAKAYLLVGKSKLLASFNIETRAIAVETLSPKLAHLRKAYFAILRNNLLYLIDGDSTYKVMFAKLLELLYTCQIPISDRQLAGSRIKFSRDGSRIMVEQSAVHKLFHIVDPKLAAISEGDEGAMHALRESVLDTLECYNPQGLVIGGSCRQDSACYF